MKFDLTADRLRIIPEVPWEADALRRLLSLGPTGMSCGIALSKDHCVQLDREWFNALEIVAVPEKDWRCPICDRAKDPAPTEGEP